MSTPMNPPVPSTPPSPSPPTLSTPSAPKSRKMLYVVVAVVAVVVVVLIAFVVLPSLTSSSGGSSGPLTYSGARSVAGSTMSGYQGGGWSLLAAIGLDSSTNASLPVNTSALGNLTSFGCAFHLSAGVTSITVPAFTGNRSSGEAPTWAFGYRNSTAIAITSVVNGQATVLGTLTGTSCSIAAQFVTPLPGNVIDSSQAASDVEPYAATFLADHPDASAAFELHGAFSFENASSPAAWIVAYSTCSLSEHSTGTGTVFNATVNALTGAVSGVHTNSSASCTLNVTTASPDGGSPIAPIPVASLRAVVRPSETV